MKMKSFAQHVLAIATLVLTFTASAEGGKHKHSFAPDVDAFHAKLSPLWHAEGDARLSNACAGAAELHKLAKAIKSSDAKALSKSAKAFKKQCKKDTAKSGDAFHDLHEAFHALIRHKD